MKKTLPVLLGLFVLCFVGLSFANNKRTDKNSKSLPATYLKAPFGEAKIKMFYANLPNALQTFSGYTTDTNYPAFAYSPDGYFGVTNSLGGDQAADEYGAFISDGTTLT